MITGRDILDTSGKYPDRVMYATPEIVANADNFAAKLAKLESAYLGAHGSLAEPFELSSGLRPDHVNAATPGASPNSAHKYGRAGDVRDRLGRLAIFCLCDQALLAHLGLYLEDPRYTVKFDAATKLWVAWTHLQDVPPKSGARVFIPHSGPIPRY